MLVHVRRIGARLTLMPGGCANLPRAVDLSSVKNQTNRQCSSKVQQPGRLTSDLHRPDLAFSPAPVTFIDLRAAGYGCGRPTHVPHSTATSGQSRSLCVPSSFLETKTCAAFRPGTDRATLVPRNKEVGQ
jgi:hypothetical protein